MTSLLRILELWRGRKAWLAAGCALSVAALLAAIALMFASGGLVAGAVAGVIVAAPLLVKLLGPVRVVLRYLERLVTHDATFRALADLRVWFFRGLADRSAGGLGFRRSGDLLSRLVNDVEALDGIYLRILLPVAGAVVLIPVLLMGIAPLGQGIGFVVTILFVMAAFAMPLLAAYAVADRGQKIAAAGASLRNAALDPIAGLREVRAFEAEGRMMDRLAIAEDGLIAEQRAQARIGAFASAAAFLCAQAAIVLILIEVHSPASVAALFLAVAAFEAVGGLPRAGATAGRAVAAARRIIEAAEGPVALPDPRQPAAAPDDCALRLDSVRFRWSPDRPYVFDGLTLDIPQGQRVAILGPSGSGKSTLAALALKVVTPQEGSVRLGGIDVATLAAADLRARIGWLSQATHLFADTIRANLLLAAPDAPDEALWAALEQARLADVVRSLPDGIDTWMGEGGLGLSGGQGRRLALARVLLTAAPILILDEPCAGLDAETEREFFSLLNDIAPGRSVILIAHRLNGIERVDRIYRLSGGRAVAAAA